jgi:hypothetical protein
MKESSMIRRIPALLLVCATLLSFSAGTAFGVPVSWTTTQVTHGALNHDEVDLSGDRIVWRNGSGYDGISTWKPGEATPTLIPTGGAAVIEPRVSGDRIAWWNAGGGPTHIDTWKLGDSAETTVASMHGASGDMQVDGDRIVWRDTTDAWTHVFTWKASDSEPTTLSGTYDASGPQVSGDRVAWYQSDGSMDQIFTSVVGSPTAQLTSDMLSNMNPQVSGNRVAWESQAADTNWYVFTWTAASGVTTVGPCESWNDGLARVSGNRVAWVHSDGAVKQILTWAAGDSHPTTVSASLTNCTDLVLSGDRLAWLASDGANDQIVTWTLGDSAPTAVTTNAVRHYAPALSGNRLAWEASDGTYSQVFTAVPAPAPVATHVTKPSVSPGTVKRKKTATFRANLTPGAAMRAAGAKATLKLYRSATKTVTKTVKGKKRRVRVSYWRYYTTLKMKSSISGSVAKLSASAKLPYRGSWKAVVIFSGATGYKPSSSLAKTFRVR